MPKFNFLVTMLTCLAFVSPALAQQNEPREYQDGARGTVLLPQGDKSFADAVVSYTAGTGQIVAGASDAQVILGAPTYSGNTGDGSFLSLGCNGVVVLQFTDNALIDVPGPDLYVFEVGPNVEGMSLAISEDGINWTELGEIIGGRAEVDLAGFVPEGASYRFVRLTDDGVDCGSRFAGADIDAVAAIGSTLRFVLDGAVLFAVDSTELRTEAMDALDELGLNIAAANLAEFRVVGHSDSTGSDAYNRALSEARALAVADYLATIPALFNVVISAQGRGESEPIASNDTEEGRRMNRRVEIIGN